MGYQSITWYDIIMHGKLLAHGPYAFIILGAVLIFIQLFLLLLQKEKFEKETIFLQIGIISVSAGTILLYLQVLEFSLIINMFIFYASMLMVNLGVLLFIQKIRMIDALKSQSVQTSLLLTLFFLAVYHFAGPYLFEN